MGHEVVVRAAATLLVATLAIDAVADGAVVDKVYHPYVEPLEWELEWRMTHAERDPVSGEERLQLHRLGLGRAVSESVFAELYLLGVAPAGHGLKLAGYEAEILWQLSEQGEFWLDYGLLFELEKEHGEDHWEYAATALLEKEFGRFSATANLGLVYEWGKGLRDELDTVLAAQARYRYSRRLEPALELYLGEGSRGLGPVIMGVERLGVARALRWEMGIILGLDGDSADYTLRALLEYEF